LLRKMRRRLLAAQGFGGQNPTTAAAGEHGSKTAGLFEGAQSVILGGGAQTSKEASCACSIG
jgi:hypothetical protein